jgi:methionyl-tRNA formyltransferase
VVGRENSGSDVSESAIVIASPHARNDRLELHVQQRLPAYRVLRFRSPADLALTALQEIKPAFVFFPHWSWLIPRQIYSSFECVIFHMTDLPYGRGGSPLQNLIVRGHKETVISALRCVEELDAGPVYMKRQLSLSGSAEEILSRASDVMEDMIVEIVETRPQPRPQEGEVVLFKRRKPEEGDISLLTELSRVYDHIRMLDADGYPPAFIETDHLHIDFRKARHTGDAVEATVRITSKPDGAPIQT